MSRFMTFYNLGVELPVSATLAAVTWEQAPAVVIAFAIYCLLEIAKYRLGFQFALTAESWTIRRSVPFTNESFYTVWAPLAAVVQLAIDEPIRLWMPIVHVVLFYPIFAAQWREIKAVLRAADWTNRVMQRLR
jgi:hypothetical protein